MKDSKSILWRVWLVYLGFAIALLAVLYKTFQIQLMGVSSVFETSVEKIPTRIAKKVPRRGEVLDINRNPLVTSVSFFDIHMDPTVVPQEDFDRNITDLSHALAGLFPEQSAREYENYIRKARSRGNRYLLIKRKATNEERKQLRSFPVFNLGRNKGGLIDSDETILRKRPHGELLKRTLGYYKPANGNHPELKVGIEGAFNAYLKGEEGEEIEQKLSTGWKKTGRVIKDAVEGADVVTSIDKEIQEVAHSELYRQLQSRNAKSGSVIVMDVKTGFVKAIANLSLAPDGEYYELYNHAVGTKEVPGSTFKLASLMAVLDDGKVDIEDTVQAASQYHFYNKTLTEAQLHNYGRITIRQAFEKSSNVFSKIIFNAYKNEPQTFVDRLKQYHFDRPLGLDLSGEPTPTLYSPGAKNWWAASLAWMAIGYEVQQTPLQMLAFYNAVANDGVFVKPQFVKEIRRGTEAIKTFHKVVLNPKICTDNTLRILKECLGGVMKKGTGKNLTNSYFEIAGKTGTAEILNDDMRYGAKGEKRYLASFVGYFPVENPMYSCIVTISASGESIYGATVSGTVFSAIANKVYASSLKYHKAINEQSKADKKVPISKDGNQYDIRQVLKSLRVPYTGGASGDWINTHSQDSIIKVSQRTMYKDRVPHVLGMTARDAVYLMENLGFKVRIHGFGSVVKQSIAAGSPVYKGGLIDLHLEE